MVVDRTEDGLGHAVPEMVRPAARYLINAPQDVIQVLIAGQGGCKIGGL